MNDLEIYFSQNTGRLIHKWNHYFEIYDRHFSRFRGKRPIILEFGVSHGGSLQMWKNYFGEGCKIYGVDINPECKKFEEESVEIFIGDQENKEFLKELASRIPHVDILIDDGGHTMKQQINTFEELFKIVDAHGVYLCEDLHTSYWKSFGGGLGVKDSFIEYSKNFIDSLHAWYTGAEVPLNGFTRSSHSLHYYDSILVIEKRPIKKPTHRKSGVPCLSGTE